MVLYYYIRRLYCTISTLNVAVSFQHRRHYIYMCSFTNKVSNACIYNTYIVIKSLSLVFSLVSFVKLCCIIVVQVSFYYLVNMANYIINVRRGVYTLVYTHIQLYYKFTHNNTTKFNVCLHRRTCAVNLERLLHFIYLLKQS